jgi:hypothetical protein
MKVTLKLNWNAYTSKHMDPIYDAHAERLGHRPAMQILHGGDHAKVITTADDADAVRAIITDVEQATVK